VSLLEHYSAYASSLKVLQNDYLRLLAERTQGREVAKLWETIKERCSWEFPALTARNRSGSIELQYRLEVRCEADQWAAAEKRKSTRSLNSIKSIKSVERQNNAKENHEDDDLLPKHSAISIPVEAYPRDTR
jgi:hypothetical protein